MSSRFAACIVVLALAPLPAAAQTTRAAQQSPGPMIFEPIHGGWLVAPDAKITEVDGRTAGLVGAYGGRITDDTFFIGGGGYWMPRQSRDREMAYGGLVVQWLARTSAPLGFSVKGLVGGGSTTLVHRITPVIDPRQLEALGLRARDREIRSHQAFFVAEPEADLLVRLTRHMRLTVGAGYRLIAAERGGDARLRGAVGTLGLQIGGGS